MDKKNKFYLIMIVIMSLVAVVVSIYQMIAKTGFDKVQVGGVFSLILIGIACVFIILKKKDKDE